MQDALLQVRDNIYAMKTLNIDMLSKKLTLERSFEKMFESKIKELYNADFDHIILDLPSSSNRTSELLLDMCDFIVVIVETNKLGVNGFYNTLQYFVDCSIDSNKIKYILPNGYSKNKSAPQVALTELTDLVNEHVSNTVMLDSMIEKSSIQSLQQKGVSVFDELVKPLTSYERSQKKVLMQLLSDIYNKIELD